MMKIRSRFLSKGLATVAVLVVALAGWVALSGVAEASEGLQFSATPSGVSVESGEASPKIASVKAEGIKKNRIRYTLSGSGKFSINRKNGRIAYDGREISKARIRVTVTAKDKDGAVDSISERITIDVTQPQAEQPVSQPQQVSETAKAEPPKFMFKAPEGEFQVFSGEGPIYVGTMKTTACQSGSVRWELGRGNGYYGSGMEIDQTGRVEYGGTSLALGYWNLDVHAWCGEEHIQRSYKVKVLKSLTEWAAHGDEWQAPSAAPDC